MKNCWTTESKQGKEYTYPYIQTTSHPPSRLLLPSSSPISNTVFSQQQTLQQWITTSGTSQVPPTAALCTHLLLHHRPTLCTTDLRDTLRSVNKAATASRFSLRRRETPRFSTTLLLLLHVSLISNLELLLYDLWLMLVFFCVGYSWIRNQGDSQAWVSDHSSGE